MNRYNNQYGFHSPKRTKKVFRKISKKCTLEFLDNSWHNDLCDSLVHEINDGQFFSIYIPNSKKLDLENEEFNFYTLIDENDNTLLETTELKEVIRFINDVLPRLMPKKHTYVLFGDDAVREYEENGVDGVIAEYEDNNLGYEIKEFTNESTVGEILYASKGFYDYIIISEDEFKKL